MSNDVERVESIDDGEAARIASGIPRLDDILKGGFIKGGTYHLVGPAGSG